MSPFILLAIAAAGVALLLVSIIKFKVPAFLALLVTSVLVALVAGIPLQDVIKTVTDGMGGTLGSVAILVGLGAMLGKMIEVSGGAQALAGKFTDMLGPKRVTAALTGAAFLLAIPVFFDVGFIILVPIVYGFAKAAGVNPMKIGLSVAAIMLGIHVVVPPHPGVVGGAAVLKADLGWTTILSLLFCVPIAVVGYFIAKRINRRDYPMMVETEKQFKLFGSGASEVEQGTVKVVAPPSPGMIITLIVLPILMIMVGTVGSLLFAKGSMAATVAGFIGAPLIALLVTIALAYYFLGIRRGWSSEHTGNIMDSALAPTAIVILVTGAGGVFGKVLTVSGIGKALAGELQSAGIPLIVMAFVLAAIVRISQGSATVAILTASGLLAASIASADLSTVQTVLVLMAIGFGAYGFSHVNDSGFWIVTRYLGLSVGDGIRTWTVITTLLSLLGFVLVAATWLLVGAL